MVGQYEGIGGTAQPYLIRRVFAVLAPVVDQSESPQGQVPQLMVNDILSSRAMPDRSAQRYEWLNAANVENRWPWLHVADGDLIGSQRSHLYDYIGSHG